MRSMDRAMHLVECAAHVALRKRDYVKAVTLAKELCRDTPSVRRDLQALEQSGIIEHKVRHCTGASGYRLVKRANQVTVGEIFESINGIMEPFDCDAYFEDELPEMCKMCLSKVLWRKANDSVREYLSKYTLADVIAGV